MIQLPQLPQSFWTASVDIPEFPKLTGDTSADVVIVGAGITGITAGYLLSKEGKKVILLDAGRVLHGTTGHTTAKITAQHDLIYDELIQHFGEEKARTYYQANRDALGFIKQTIEEEKISCDFAEEDAYIYTQSEQNAAKLEKELYAYETLGIPGELRESINLPLEINSALVMTNQARFHPTSYLTVLIDRMVRSGSQIFELTTVVKVEEGESPVVVTEDGNRITCRHVISASHYPFLDLKGFFFARMHAERSYVLGVRIKQAYTGGMYLSAD